MPIDSNIALGIRPPQFESPVNTLANVLGIQQAQQQNQLGRMRLDENQRNIERQNKLYSLLGSVDPSAGDEGRANALYGGGFLTEAEAVRKSASERQRAAAQAQKDSAEAASKAFDDQVKRSKFIGSAMAHVMRTPTPENANLTIDLLADRKILTPEQAAAYKAKVAENPAGIAAMAEAEYRAALDADKQLLNFQNQNTGGVTNTLANDAVSGKSNIVGTVTNTQTPDSVASNARMAADAAAGRAVTRRGQDLTDARARDANDINKILTNEKKQLEVDALKRGKESAIAATANQVAVIDKALNHPGRATATGLSGTLDPRNYIAGTDATDFRVVLDQIGGAAFLQAFESLKGGGAITEVEGKRATDAIARLNRAQSDGEFESALNELRSVMTEGYKRLSGKEYVVPPSKAGKPATGFTYIGKE
jgi:hypothetical protein